MYTEFYADEATGMDKTAALVKTSKDNIVCETSYDGFSVPKIGGIVGGLALIIYGIVKAVSK